MTKELNLNFESQEEKDQFIRAVMICQVWGKTLREEPSEIAHLLEDNDEEIGREYDKLVCGADNEFSRAMADHFNVPYQRAGTGIKLGRPYGPRYHQAWKDLGVTPSDSEKAAVSSALTLLKNVYDGSMEDE